LAYEGGDGLRFAAGALGVLSLAVVGGALFLVLGDTPSTRVAGPGGEPRSTSSPATPPPTGLLVDRGSPADPAPPPVAPPPLDAGLAAPAPITDGGPAVPALDAGVALDAGPPAAAAGPGGNASLTGELRDPQNRAVPRVTVRLTRKEGTKLSDLVTLTAGEDGRFRAELLPEGGVIVEARAVGYQTKIVENVTLVSGETRHVDLVLVPGKRLEGRVVDDSGEPVAGAEVTAVPPAEDDSGDQVQQSKNDGRFAFEELGGGPFCLYARKAPYVDAESCNVRPGGELVLRMTRPGAIAGRVVRAVGAVPIPEFTVSVMPRAGANDSDMPTATKTFKSPTGDFKIDDLAAGAYTLTVRAENRLFGERSGIEVRGGETTSGLVLELGGQGRIVGSVVSSADGKPIEGAKIELLLGGRMGGGSKVVSDAQGRFELDNVSSGAHRVNVERTGFHPILLQSLGTAAVGGDAIVLRMRPKP